ncbi:MULTISPECIES: ectoine/hydroxyectoine ABC transporter permease subunit EhuD [Brevibacterium]|uniref:Ectoine/hydroxyectoine ABC transporter permease subunit EhuD n=1 Tax=Brevibacterium aurantiacum TaxID=273384 RepID=A0A556CF31_BREAU|nr:ectoine/hydroxyectoine ABC transporter permease subunit EhuD [Brevibacterium aurantiacum]MBM6588600.1 ectoine/hydroxyectoine ABC transporter permease subunit EhuD [Brevibacterium sp. RIT 803]TSI16032.1 ectoine/hydroxyectoine ABC transporter permease subunit EhuD [Brevibacterium aurantiacum]
MTWNWEFAVEALPILLQGFVNTLIATVVGTVIAAILGLLIAVAIRTLPRWINWLVRLLVAFVRNTPLIVQLMFVYFAFSDIPGLVSIPALAVGCIVIGIHYSTYMSESYRAGIDSVPPGQHEAATALSLPPVRTFTAVVLPQALRATIPSLGNYAVAMFKDTPFLFAISVVELVTSAKQFGGSTFAYTEAFTLAGIIFLAASYPTSLLIQRLDKRLATY